MQCIPTAADTNLINQFKGDQKCLGTAERFLIEANKIPNMRFRLESLIMKDDMVDDIKMMKRNIDLINEASMQIRNSYSLRICMCIALYIGNILNQGTFRAAANAFKIEDLLKFKELRANSQFKSQTLLNFLDFYMESFNENTSQSLKNELNSVNLASVLSTNTLLQDLDKWRSQISNVYCECLEHLKTPSIQKNLAFYHKMSDFCKDTTREIEKLADILHDAQNQNNCTILHFNLDPADVTIESLESDLATFLSSLQRAHSDNSAQDGLYNSLKLNSSKKASLEPGNQTASLKATSNRSQFERTIKDLHSATFRLHS